MTKLTDIIVKQIEQSGPITVAEYMTQCLLHPEYGYYTTQHPLGSKGDFVTAPEISQMFGEMLGLCLAQTWMDQGAPQQFTLAELGPGRGTLIADILRTTRNIKGFNDAANIVLMEASPSLRSEQQAVLNEYKVHWVKNVTDLPNAPLFLIANEFYDCLPINQYVRTTHGWQQQMISTENGSLGFILADYKPVELFEDAPMGSVIETCPSAIAITTEISHVIGTHSGCALIIDYGDWRQSGDSFQAVQNHCKVEPFHDCGASDLTAHVNFKSLTIATQNFAQTSGLTTQGTLLERLGITARAQALAENLEGKPLENLITAHRRLTHPDEMGHLFKALAITPIGAAHPPGFDI